MKGSMTLEEFAAFAAKKHVDRGYTYADGVPYSVHLNGVANLVRKYAYLLEGTGVDPDDVEKAAHGHDLYEDCGLTFNDLSKRCGTNAARMILAVSDVPGEDRIEKIYLTLPKVRAAGLGATLLKLCDRMFNGMQNGSMQGKYRVEYPIVRYILISRTDMVFRPLWEDLDKMFGYEES